MEQPAGSLGEASLLSEAARKRLPTKVEAQDMGRQSLHSLEGQHAFYAL